MYFILVPRLNLRRFLPPLLLGLSGMLGLQLAMTAMPQGASTLILLGVIVEAVVMSALSPLISSLQMIHAEQEQRARIFGWFYFMSLAVTSPFGIIAGILSKTDRSYPFYLTAVLAVLAIVAAVMLSRVDQDGGPMVEAAPQEIEATP